MDNKTRTISYSQYSTHMQCPHKWELKYIKDKKIDKPSIYLLFGTAMHEVIQQYLEIMYKTTAKHANELELDRLLHSKMKKIFLEEKEKHNMIPASKEEMVEFFQDGTEILHYLKSHRAVYFPVKDCELRGIETELNCKINDEFDINLHGFIDLVLYYPSTKRYKVIDIKTSTRGWGDWKKKDKRSTDQVIIYKKYFSKQFNVPIENIDVEFFIVKRKLYEDSMYPQKRIQVFVPPHGKVSINRVVKNINKFLHEGFLSTGEYNIENDFKAVKGYNGWNCKYCEFNTREDLCPGSERE